MKILYILTTLLFLLIGFNANASQSIKGDCYQTTIVFEKAGDENTLTICIDNNKIVERMLFSNKGGIPAVCYQKGSIKKVSKNNVILSYTEGYCDNGNPYKNPPLACRIINKKNLYCKDSDFEVTLDYVGVIK